MSVEWSVKMLLLVAAAAMGPIMLSGCASHETTATTSANPAERTYSRGDLNRTGRPDTAGAIEGAAPDAQIR